MSDDRIPIIGQGPQVIFWYPTAIVRCLCQPGVLTIIVVTGLGNHSLCNSCGKLYCIKTFRFVEGDLTVEIETTLPTPKGAVN